MTARPESPAALLGEVVSGIARLVRGEFALARAEARRSLGDATSALAKLVVAAIFGLCGLNTLAAAAVAALVAAGSTSLWAPVWSGLAVGSGLLLVAGVLVQIGMRQLTPANLAPKRMMANLRQDAETLKSMVVPDVAAPNQP